MEELPTEINGKNKKTHFVLIPLIPIHVAHVTSISERGHIRAETNTFAITSWHNLLLSFVKICNKCLPMTLMVQSAA